MGNRDYGIPANESGSADSGLSGVILRFLLAARYIGWPMLGGQVSLKAPRWRWRRDSGCVKPKEEATGRSVDVRGHEGSKSSALNSSILVAAPRWRRLCRCRCLTWRRHIGRRPAKWRAPPSAIRILAVSLSEQAEGKGLRGRRKLEKARRRGYEKGSRLRASSSRVCAFTAPWTGAAPVRKDMSVRACGVMR